VLQTVISPVIGSLVDHFGFTPVCWLVALPPLGGWLLLRRMAVARGTPQLSGIETRP
jgi:hypothetical protein